MQALKAADAAAVVAERIADVLEIAASAAPVPEDLGAVLPCVVVYNVGGYRDAAARVLDTAALSIDVYGETPEQAMNACRTVAALVNALQDADGSPHVYRSPITTEPYDNPDPMHPTIPRATCAADIVTRGEVITI